MRLAQVAAAITVLGTRFVSWSRSSEEMKIGEFQFGPDAVRGGPWDQRPNALGESKAKEVNMFTFISTFPIGTGHFANSSDRRAGVGGRARGPWPRARSIRGGWLRVMALLVMLVAATSGSRWQAAALAAQCPPEWATDIGVPGMDGTLVDLTVFDDGTGPALYAGGFFTTAGGVSANGIAKWNPGAPGAWSPLGSGMNAGLYALTVFDDGTGPALYAGGNFTTAGGVSANYVAKWNPGVPGAWSPLGSGMNAGLYALTVFDDGTGPALYAGGSFTTAGVGSANRIAKWNGSSWSALGSGMNGDVRALAVFDDGTGPDLYAGGYFTTAGGVSANRIAKWNGAAWSALGSGMNDYVSALTVFDDGTGPALYVGGYFTTAGGVSANRIAKWNPGAPGTWSALGSGMSAGVLALTVFDEGSGPALYAGGFFTTAGGVSANKIAKWNPGAPGTWSALGSGMSGMSAGVFALTVFDDGTGSALYAGGQFTTAGGGSANQIAQWEPGCPVFVDPGADNCSAARVVPVAVGPSGSPNTVTILGDNSTASGSDCTNVNDLGWWEAFQIGAYAKVTIDFCGTNPVLRPAWAGVYSACGCVGQYGYDYFDRTTTCPFNISITFLGLPPGTYYYPVYTILGDRRCGNTGATCTLDSECTPGVVCTDNLHPYVMHISAEAALGSCCNPGGSGVCTANVCVGGPNNGQLCVIDPDCGPGGVCASANPPVCVGGPNNGNVCTVDADCAQTATCFDDFVADDCPAPQRWGAGLRCCETECRELPPSGPEFDSLNVTLLSRTPLSAFPDNQDVGAAVTYYVSPSGGEYAIMTFNKGTGFVRVTGPGSPEVVGYIDGEGIVGIHREAQAFNGYAYIVTDDGPGVGLQVVDLSNIDGNVVLLANTTQLGVGFITAHTLFINHDSRILYLNSANHTGRDGLVALDLDLNPVEPPIVGTWLDPNPDVHCHDSTVVSYTSGPYAGREIAFCFAENDGLKIVDVTDKSSMFTLSQVVYPNTTYSHQGWPTEDRRFLFINDEGDETSGAVSQTTSYVVNIEDLLYPYFLTSFSNGLCAVDHNEMVRGNFLYEANYSTGLRIFNICDINNVHEVGHFDTRPEDNAVGFDGMWGVDTRLPSGVVITSDRQRGLFVFDVSAALAAEDDCQIRYVDGDGVAAGANNGTSWANAYRYLQDALAYASTHPSVTEIWVAEGKNKPNLKGCVTDSDCNPGAGTCVPPLGCIWPAPREQTFQLLNGVALYGGFHGDDHRCVGGYFDGAPCMDDSSCSPLLGNCEPNTCIGGSLHGYACWSNADCPGGMCGIRACVGGPFDGLTCSTDEDCFGGACMPRVCYGGPLDGILCTVDAECSGGVCITAPSRCVGPPFHGMMCITAADCNPPPGTCLVTNPGETLLSQRDPAANPTILSGDVNGDDAGVVCTTDPDCIGLGDRCINGYCPLSQNMGENSYHVLRGENIDATAVLDGFTITAGYADGGLYDNKGAGITNFSASYPTVTRCMFRGNWAQDFGAGVDDGGGGGTFRECTFENNAAGIYGGGMSTGTFAGRVIDCIFINNTAAQFGGGLNMSYAVSGAEVRGCTFRGNSANGGGGLRAWGGGGLIVVNCRFLGNSGGNGGGGGVQFLSHTGGSLTNCEFSGNRAIQGAALYVDASSATTVLNSTFSGNVGTSIFGGGIAVDPLALPFTLTNSILWGNSDSSGFGELAQLFVGTPGNANIQFNVIQGYTGTVYSGVGNIALDPLFFDLNGADNIVGTIDDDLRLRPGSSAIDAGSTPAVPADTADLDGDADTAEQTPYDLDGNPRLVDDLFTPDTGVPGSPVVDMGAYEFQFPDCNANGIDDRCEIDCGPPGGPCFDTPGCGWSPDCNANGILDYCEADCNANETPDDCDIAACVGNPACRVCVGGPNAGMPCTGALDCPGGVCPASNDDCNLNGVPDSCDIASGFSQDNNVPPDGVPDECVFTLTSGNWSDPIWGLCADPPICDDDHPDTYEAVPNLHVTIGSGIDVLLDKDVLIDSLRILEGGILRATPGTASGGSAAGPPSPVYKEEILEHISVAGSKLTAYNQQTCAGTFDAAGVCVPTGSVTIEARGSWKSDTSESTAALTAVNITIEPSACGSGVPGGVMEVTDSMRVTAASAISVKGFDKSCSFVCPLEGSAAQVLGITPPPKLKLTLQSMLDADSFVLTGIGQSSNASSQPVVLSGDFTNYSVAPSGFDWSTGTLLLSGSTEQKFEVAGVNFGQDARGFSTDFQTLYDPCPHKNFSLGTLEVAAGSQVRFINEFANTAGIGCAEALYVHELTLGAEATVTIDNCKVYYTTLSDGAVTPTLLGCAELLPDVPPANIVWNANDQGSRSLRFDVDPPATATGSGVALQVTMVDLQTPNPDNRQCCPAPNFHAFDMGSPPSCSSCTGEACPAAPSPPDPVPQGGCARWVGEPGEFREAQDVPSAGTFIGARLQCTPFYNDWNALGKITVLGAEILPSSTYSVQAYGASCKGSEAGCTNVSDAVTMKTHRSGDVVTPFNLVEPTGLDINEVINKFKGLTSTPKALAQLTQNVVDPYVDVGGLDISAVIDAFKSFAYSHSGPCPCPSTVTCGPAAGSVACASLQCRTCVSGANAGKPCSLAGDCPGGACSGTVLTCVKTCVGGDNIGDPCIKDIHCPGTPASTCGNPFCRDRCGRCSP